MTDLTTATAGSPLFYVSPEQAASIMERVIAENGDLYQLSAIERKIYYLAMCKQYGLDPFSSPFDYLSQRINAGTKDRPDWRDRVTLYPNQRASNAFAQRNKISTTIQSKEFDGKTWIVTVVAQTPSGQAVEDVGASDVTNWVDKGTALKKAISQARRRAVLALAGFSSADDETRSISAEAYDVPMDVLDGLRHAIPDTSQPAIAAEVVQDSGREVVMSTINEQLTALGWDAEKAKKTLKEWYGVQSRQKLTDEQLIEFSDRLLHLATQTKLRELEAAG